jgi:hypothetical protein
LQAQRLVAQALGRFRLVAVILAGILKTHSNVHSRSLGQVACSHVLGGNYLINRNGAPPITIKKIQIIP